jgi:hypothetical protein
MCDTEIVLPCAILARRADILLEILGDHAPVVAVRLAMFGPFFVIYAGIVLWNRRRFRSGPLRSSSLLDMLGLLFVENQRTPRLQAHWQLLA